MMKPEFEICGYRVTSIVKGTHLNGRAISFVAEKDGYSFPLKTKLDNELIRDMYCILGLDPVEELERIALAEIEEELCDPRRNP